MSEEKQELKGDEEAKKTSQEDNSNTGPTAAQDTSPKETTPAGNSGTEAPAADVDTPAENTPIEHSDKVEEPAASGPEDEEETTQEAFPEVSTEAKADQDSDTTGPDTDDKPEDSEITEPVAAKSGSDHSEMQDSVQDEIGEPAANTEEKESSGAQSEADLAMAVVEDEEVNADKESAPAAAEDNTEMAAETDVSESPIAASQDQKPEDNAPDTSESEPQAETTGKEAAASDEVKASPDETGGGEEKHVSGEQAVSDPAMEVAGDESVNADNNPDKEATQAAIENNAEVIGETSAPESTTAASQDQKPKDNAPDTSETETQAETTEKEAAASDGVKTSADETGDSEEEEHEEELIDYSGYSREQLADVVDELSKQENFKRSDAILSKVLPLFKAMARARRQEALDRFLAEGGEQDDFEYRHDEVFNRFDASVRLIRDKRASYYKEREARKEANYQKKLEILDKLRELIDGENATTNLAPIKALQEEWKAVGPVPAQHNRTLWANYNALLDRFYNNRHILFELKELDRKKNLVKKTELCEKAEALDKLENIKDAIVQLNELHEEYKKIGAVPREVQEELWQRFKAASDAIYKKRKSYLEDLKGELHQNLEKKRALAEELKPFMTFNSDRINDWNAKTKEILAIQKKWDALGGLPREHAKEVNKAFWSSFKAFFSNKNAFFKKLEGTRHENLQKKEELVAQAEALKDNTDWDKTSEALKALQRQWKEIGPVPEKFRNSVYAKFKEACDTFFNNRRASQNKAEAQYVENQKHKEDLIKEINEKAKAGDGKPSELDDIMVRWGAIGFVPRGAIKSVEEKFAKAIEAFVNSLDVEEEEREALVLKAELSSLKKGPNSDRRLNKKEATLRKQIQELEDNINLWNNNLAFFANSKTADKLKEEFDEKIAKAEEEIAQLKKQLRVVRSM